MKTLIKILEFISACVIVIILFIALPIRLWLWLLGIAVFLRVIQFMFSARNLERQGRKFNVR